MVQPQNISLESTSHNIPVDPARMDGPADGAIFKSSHLGEIGDIHSKHIVHLARSAEFYCHTHTQYINPMNEELANFMANRERDFDSYCHHISLPCFIPTTAELCTLSITDIIDNMKADLAYFKEDLRNLTWFMLLAHQSVWNP